MLRKKERMIYKALKTEMRVLILSAILYLAGVALVLFFRPRYMFHEDGTWKEFGMGGDDRTTYLPVWLFCAVWAVLSYFIVKLFIGDVPTTIKNAAIAGATASVNSTTILQNTGEQLPPPPAPNKNTTRNTRNGNARRRNGMVEVMKPGYYKLDRDATGENNVPRYIYLGATAPAAPEDEMPDTPFNAPSTEGAESEED
jgi:hypothetical protein